MATLDDLTTAGAKSLVGNDFRLTAHRAEVLHPPVAEATTNLDIDPEMPAHPSAGAARATGGSRKAFDEFVRTWSSPPGGLTMPNGDHVVRLRDGRTMSYAEYGDPDGVPTVNGHGGFSCRLELAAAAPVATQMGVRLISPDRPGIGRSDPQPDRTVLDWARDVAELLDQIDVDRFAVMG
jgi:hypothetical protein